jgi:hypothetical protein
MVTKYLVTVREVYEQEEKNEVFSHRETGTVVSPWDYSHDLTDEQKKEYVRKLEPTGKMEVKENETPIYNQTFELNDLRVSDLVLYLNRVK